MSPSALGQRRHPHRSSRTGASTGRGSPSPGPPAWCSRRAQGARRRGGPLARRRVPDHCPPRRHRVPRGAPRVVEGPHRGHVAAIDGSPTTTPTEAPTVTNAGIEAEPASLSGTRRSRSVENVTFSWDPHADTFEKSKNGGRGRHAEGGLDRRASSRPANRILNEVLKARSASTAGGGLYEPGRRAPVRSTPGGGGSLGRVRSRSIRLPAGCASRTSRSGTAAVPVRAGRHRPRHGAG